MFMEKGKATLCAVMTVLGALILISTMAIGLLPLFDTGPPLEGRVVSPKERAISYQSR